MKTLKSLFTITPFKLSLLITTLFFGISFIYDIIPKSFPIIQELADKSLDLKFKLRGPALAKNKIVIIAGDDKAFEKFGQWPFDRGSVFAPMLEKLCSYNPKAIGLDIVWADQEKLITPSIKQAIATSFQKPTESIDTLVEQYSGDYLLRKVIENCRDKIVLGYALDAHKTNPTNAADQDERIKTLIESGKNTLLAAQLGKIIYPSLDATEEANVPFSFIANSGLFNVNTLTFKGVSQGFFNNEQDSDGNYRRSMFFWRFKEQFVSSLALRMAQKADSGKQNPDAQPMLTISPENPDKNQQPNLKLELTGASGTKAVPIDLFGQAITNYRGPNQTFPNISMADVLSNSDEVEYEQYLPDNTSKKVRVKKAEVFQDALLILGITAQSLYDIRPRPLDPAASGVENHANILDNLLSEDFILRPTTTMLFSMLAVIFVISLIYGYGIAKLNAKLGFVFAGIFIGAMFYFDQYYLFNEHRIFSSGQLQAIQFLIQFIAITVLKYIQEEDDKKFIRSAFDKYVSPAIVDSMLKDPSKLRLGGEKKELSILFSDIRGFTELSEKVDVKQLTLFLNEYLGAMTEILQKNLGTLDKYIGDAVMGFWGAPIDISNHAECAVQAAVGMMLKLDELNESFSKKYNFTIDIGIGINSGPVSVGNFGSSKVFEFTVIGDNVNLASRLEGINKYYGTHIIISESTYDAIDKTKFLIREVDTVKVKGKKKPVKIFEVFPDNKSHETLKSALPEFNKALKSYYAKEWDSALVGFGEVLKARSQDKTSSEMIERCKYFLENPPEMDWDGSFEMKSK